MSSRTPNITALTNDYDAIERAIRETSRGRWFLHCYLERNRSAETRMLLDAIARLEGAMRDNGLSVEALAPAEAVARIGEAIGEARTDIAHMVTAEGDIVPLPLPRFSFGSITRSVSASGQAIHDAAEAVETAARALRDTGVFHGIARQLAEKSDEILRACAVQKNAIRQMDRLTEAMSEIEAEVIAVIDGRGEANEGLSRSEGLRALHRLGAADARAIPEDVMRELSRALAGPHPVDDAAPSPDDPLPPLSG